MKSNSSDFYLKKSISLSRLLLLVCLDQSGDSGTGMFYISKEGAFRAAVS